MLYDAKHSRQSLIVQHVCNSTSSMVLNGSLLSGIERSSWRERPPEWGRTPAHLIHRMSFGGQFPWRILVLPHSGRVSCQLLLSMTDTFAPYQNKPFSKAVYHEWFMIYWKRKKQSESLLQIHPKGYHNVTIANQVHINKVGITQEVELMLVIV